MNERLTQLADIAADTNYEGLGTTQNGKQYVDQRLTPEAVERLGLSPRSADLNIVGPAIIYLSEDEAAQVRAASVVQRD